VTFPRGGSPTAVQRWPQLCRVRIMIGSSIGPEEPGWSSPRGRGPPAASSATNCGNRPAGAYRSGDRGDHPIWILQKSRRNALPLLSCCRQKKKKNKRPPEIPEQKRRSVGYSSPSAFARRHNRGFTRKGGVPAWPAHRWVFFSFGPVVKTTQTAQSREHSGAGTTRLPNRSNWA